MNRVLPRISWACAALLAGCSSSRSLGRGVSIDRLRPELRLESELRDESTSNGAGASTKELIFRENVKFDVAANVYHPKLLELGGVLDLGLEQRQLDQSGTSSTVHSDSDNTRYDLSASVLKDHPYSVRAFAQRSHARVRQSFFPTNDAVVTRNGALVMAKEWIVPSQLEVATYQFDGESGLLRHEERDSLNLSGSRSTERVDVNYMVFAQQVDSDLAGGRYDDFQALGGATWRFGEELSNSVSLDAQRRSQTGDTDNANTSVGGRTHFSVADDLANRSGVSFSSSEYGGSTDSRTDRIDAFTELEHKLFASLTSIVRADYLEQSFGSSNLDRIGGSGSLSYRKRVAFGELQAFYRLAQSRQDEAGRLGAFVTISGEPHAVVPGTPVILDNQNVNDGTVLVTDSTGSVVYSTPADYLVERIGPSTRLTFPVGSQILAGQTILVTYTFASSFDRVFDTNTQSAGVELHFADTLSLNARWTELDQHLVSGTAGTTLDQATEIGAGFRIRVGAQNLEFEYLDHDSRLTPYARARLTWYASFPIVDTLRLGANASAYETEFKDQRLEERGYAGLLNLDWNPDDQLSVELRSELRRSELRTEDGWGTFLQGILRYRFRMTAVEFSLLNSTEDWNVSSDRDVLRANLTVSRRF